MRLLEGSGTQLSSPRSRRASSRHVPPHGPNPHGHALTDASVQGIYIGDELLGLGVLVKDLDAILELCKEVWPEGITCASSDLTHGPRCLALTAVAGEEDYNEEWYPINDPTWHDKSGQPYGKVPAALDWISYDVRSAATANPFLLRRV